MKRRWLLCVPVIVLAIVGTTAVYADEPAVLAKPFVQAVKDAVRKVPAVAKAAYDTLGANTARLAGAAVATGVAVAAGGPAFVIVGPAAWIVGERVTDWVIRQTLRPFELPLLQKKAP